MKINTAMDTSIVVLAIYRHSCSSYGITRALPVSLPYQIPVCLEDMGIVWKFTKYVAFPYQMPACLDDMGIVWDIIVCSITDGSMLG